ncbi:hypothetical protein OAA26_00080 [bacterium]|nr:hypothetical protein [bacterium]
MATPLNAFKTKVWTLRDSAAAQGVLVYNTPPGVTAIVLMAQISNIDSDLGSTSTFSFVHKDVGTGQETPLVRKFPVRQNDAASPLTGKLIIQEGNQIFAYCHKRVTRSDAGGVGTNDADDTLNLTLSLLESLNA